MDWEQVPRLPGCWQHTGNRCSELKPGTFGLEKRQGALNGNCEMQLGLNPSGAFWGLGFTPCHGPFQMASGGTGVMVGKEWAAGKQHCGKANLPTCGVITLGITPTLRG